MDTNTGDTTTITDLAGQLTTFRYDSNRNRIAIIDALSRRVTYFYNSHGQQTGIRNPLNFRATFVKGVSADDKLCSLLSTDLIVFSQQFFLLQRLLQAC